MWDGTHTSVLVVRGPRWGRRATVDTKAAAWLANNGTACPGGTQVAYNDDFCALQTRISWTVTAGQTYFKIASRRAEAAIEEARSGVAAAAARALGAR